MKDWPWQKWVGKIAPIVVGLLAQGIWSFLELPAPGWAAIISGAITFGVQQILALFPPKAPE